MSLYPFTQKKYTGFGARPKLMTGINADTAIILNLLAYLSDGSAGTAVRNKPGSLNHVPVYKYINVHPVIVDPCMRVLESIQLTQRRVRRRMRGKQKP